jgi:DNA-binding LacI/PurR family transcriptional regulator
MVGLNVAKSGTPNPKPRVTLKFLSERLGLSRTTISLVLNDSPLASTIAPKTRDNVLKAAKKYNYKPNYFARYLNQRRSYLVGVLSPDMSLGYESEVLAGIEGHLLTTEYQYFLTSHQWSRERIHQTVQLFLERGVEGIIMMNTPLQLKVDVPVIRIGGQPPSGKGMAISIDNEVGIRCALSHLVSLGHRKIAFVKGHKGSGDTESRWRAITESAKALSLKINPKLVVQLQRLGMQQTSALEEGALCVAELLSRSSDFTAVLAFNDMSAIGAMHKLQDAGFRVPEDVSVVGFDDIVAARIAYPQLTTVRQPLREMGERAACELIESISEGAPNEGQIVMLPNLVVRNSTAPVSHGASTFSRAARV